MKSIKFAQLEVSLNVENDVVLRQYTPFQEGDDIISFPLHQAEAVIKAINEIISEHQTSTVQEPDRG